MKWKECKISTGKCAKHFEKVEKFANFKVLKGKDFHNWNVQIWIFKNLLQKFVMECVSQTLEKSKALERKVLKENQRLQISKRKVFLKCQIFKQKGFQILLSFVGKYLKSFNWKVFHKIWQKEKLWERKFDLEKKGESLAVKCGA